MSLTHQSVEFAQAASRLLGWAYFACWSVSFYPQLVINYRRKAVTGLAVDFFLVNVLGFACYTVSAALFLFSPVVRSQYAARHPNAPEPTTRANDLAFAAHALLISAVTFSQLYFWGYKRLSTQRLSRAMTGLLLVCGIVLVASMLLVPASFITWQWIDVVYVLQYIKLFISIIKYTPQAYLNYQRKSTVGWAIQNILLDLSGGILSLAQLVLDSSLQGDWSGLTGNPIKFFLGQISIAFDVIFILQHYVLYRHIDQKKPPERPLARGRSRPSRSEEEEQRFGRRRFSGYNANDDEEEALLEQQLDVGSGTNGYGTGDARDQEGERRGLLSASLAETVADGGSIEEAVGR